MANSVFLFILYVYESILRGTDSRTKRYFVFNYKSTFLKDMLDFCATLMMIRANTKVGTIHDDNGNVFNIKEYSLPTKLKGFMDAGESYLFDSGKQGEAEPLFKFKWDEAIFAKAVAAFMLEKQNDVKGFNYEFESAQVMSPDRMERFYRNLNVDNEKLSSDMTFEARDLQEFETVLDDQGRVFLIHGSAVESVPAFISGVVIPSKMGEYLREITRPTEEEMKVWFTKMWF